jgi:hypothetical protein
VTRQSPGGESRAPQNTDASNDNSGLRRRPGAHEGRRRLIDHAAALRRLELVDCAHTLDKWAFGCPNYHARDIAETSEVAVDPLPGGCVGLRLLDDGGDTVTTVFLDPANL